MPFIWDDWEWKLIGDDEEFDYSRFVLVKKLFVKLKTTPTDANVSVQLICFVYFAAQKSTEQPDYFSG